MRDNMIEKVKKILRRDRSSCRTVQEWIAKIEADAQQICQLFPKSNPDECEPKFNNALEADAHNWDTRELEPKPDEGRLLTDEERVDGYPWLTEYKEELDWYLTKQDAKTVSIIKASDPQVLGNSQKEGVI